MIVTGTTITAAGLPHVNVTVPVSCWPGVTEENSEELKVMGIFVPKL